MNVEQSRRLMAAATLVQEAYAITSRIFDDEPNVMSFIRRNLWASCDHLFSCIARLDCIAEGQARPTDAITDDLSAAVAHIQQVLDCCLEARP